MKIAVIGASGKAGSRIVREALLRRHEVTAIVRNVSRLEDSGIPRIEKNLFDLTTDDLRPFDAVIDAFGTAFDPESARAHQTAMAHMIEIMTPIPQVRLLVVGGAGSLYTSRGSRRLAMEDIPEQWRAVPANMAAAFEALKASNVNWTYFSPAFTFDPDGPRTGKYISGDNELTSNSEGESYLSYADYAVAMLDEAEDGQYIRKRFTAASEKTPHKDGYWGTELKAPKFEGISNYRPHLNYELTGQTFRLVMDTTDDITVQFLTRNRLEYRRGDRIWEENYECAKGAEMAYFVNFELTGVTPRTNITLFLDTMTRLVTVVTTWTGLKPQYPTLCDDKFEFGAIDTGDLPLPKKRHRYTMDLVGKRIHWHYGPDFSIIHVYYHTNFCRGTFTPERLAKMPPPTPESRAAWKENPYDEKATYVKMREGLYAVSFVEQSMARSGRVGNSLLFMMNTDRLHDVGRSFGHSGQFGGTGYLPENYLFGAYGEWVTNDGGDTLDDDPPFYQV